MKKSSIWGIAEAKNASKLMAPETVDATEKPGGTKIGVLTVDNAAKGACQHSHNIPFVSISALEERLHG